MSDAAAEKADKEPAAAGGGNKKLLIIVMIVNVLLIGGLAYVVISSRNQAAAAAAAALKQAHPAKHGEGEEEGEAAEGEADAKEEPAEGEKKGAAKGGKFGPLLEIGTFVANLSTPPGEQGRYAKVTLHAEALNEEAKARVEGALVPIKSEALMLLSNAKPEDIIGADNIKKLADELVKRTNKLLGKKSIKQIYFAELVVQ